MDLQTILSSSFILGVLGTLIGIIWKNLNAKVQENCKHLSELGIKMEDKYISKELYQRDMSTLERDVKDVKSEMKETMKLVQQLLQEVSLIRVRLDEILKRDHSELGR